MDVDWDEWDEDFDPPKAEQKWDKSGTNSRHNPPPEDEWDEDFDPPKAEQKWTNSGQIPPEDEWDNDLDMNAVSTGRFREVLYLFT